MNLPAIGQEVYYGIPPGRIHKYRVTAHKPLGTMIELTRYDARLNRDVVINVYPDEILLDE